MRMQTEEVFGVYPHGLSDEQIEGILGPNALRVFSRSVDDDGSAQ